MKIKGYHNTEASKVSNILQHGFICKHSDKHWLGQGIYFFADSDSAFDNIDMLKHDHEIKTIAVEINVEDSKVLDLDITESLNSFRIYCKNQSSLLKESGQELFLKDQNGKQAILKYRCFFLDLYKQENDYVVISKTFPKDNPPYAEPLDNIKYFGLPFLEKYICVTSNEYIIRKDLMEREWIV